MRFRLEKGLDLELPGAPLQEVGEARRVSRVAVLPPDHVGLRARLLVAEGERVRAGQPLVASRDLPELVLTSPGGGRVAAIERGPRRALRAVAVELSAEEERVPFEATPRAALAALAREEVVRRLLGAGLWPALRARPFGHAADPRVAPRALLVTAIDTNPLAPRPEVALAGRERLFEDGLAVLARLLDGPLFLCVAEASALGSELEHVTVARFSGPHPAGLAGTHAHLLAPAGRGRVVWHVGYQDVAAVGALFTEGRLELERVIAIGGPRAARPRLVRTRLGASLEELLAGELAPGPTRVVSGSALSGRQASGWGRFLGRFHVQVTALVEGLAREDSASWLRRSFGSWRRAAGSALHGRPAHFLALDVFERVLPLGLHPAPLLRALLAGDAEQAERLGCLELEEEDLALCSYVCPAKHEYGARLRDVLEEIARAG